MDIMMNATGLDKFAKYTSQQTLFQVVLQSVAMLKRNKVASLFVLPFAVFIWVIGWAMCLAGEKKGNPTKQNLQNQMS
jgi:hypothetical protein